VFTPERRVRRRRPVARAAAVVASLVVVTVAACQASAPRPNPAPVRVLSNYERATGNTIPRDCGYSSPLPSKPGWSLWLFCDTAIASPRDGRLEHLILGTDTAAAGPYLAGQVPSRLSEIPTPPAPLTGPSAAAPQPFLPAPQSLLLPGGALACTGPGAYPASWISGMTRDPSAGSSNLLISYDDYCVTGNADSLTAEGFGLAEYDPARNLLGPPVRVFASVLGLALSPQQVLGSPLARPDGYLYLFGFCRAAAPPDGCGPGRVFLARTLGQPAYWQNPLTYTYWTPAGWSPDEAAATSLIPASGPLGISVGDYTADGHGLVMVEQTSLAGGFQVWQAASPAGPWRRILAGQVPCRAAAKPGAPHAGQPGAQPAAGDLCRALIGHPELSTRSRLLISYFNPGNSHVDVSAYAW
jgi:hypothetical protein